MENFKLEGGRLFINHHGRPLFPLPNPLRPYMPTLPIGAIMTLLCESLRRIDLNLKKGMLEGEMVVSKLRV